METKMALIPEPIEIEPLAVSPKKAGALIDVGTTRLYHLIGTGEVESFRDGKSRKIIFASLKAYIARQIAAEAAKPRIGWTDRATEARMSKKNASRSRRRGA
jgi:aspartate-semialdehyde dehydrogenase